MSDISLELLKLFCTVAETGKIYKAAESLYISQPAVTQDIKKLETQLGGSLFYRTPKGVVLTEQGKSLYSFVKPSTETLENVPNKFSQYINLEEGKINIHAGKTISQLILFEPLHAFIKKYPNIKIELSSGRSVDAIEDVAVGKKDIAIITLPEKLDRDDVDVIELPSLTLKFVASKQFLKENNIDINNLDDILKCNLILPYGSSNSGKIINSYFQNKGIDIKSSYTISSNTTRVRLALWNAGIAVIEDYPLEDSEVVKSNVELSKIKIGLVTQKKKIASYSTLKLIDYILGKGD